MKKLRIALIVLFSALMSLALVACGSKKCKHVDENPKDGNCDLCGEKMISGQLASVDLSGSIVITDAQGQSEALAQLNAMTITAHYDDDVPSKVLTSADYTLDWSGVNFGTTGSYTATLTVLEENYFEDVTSIPVTINHDLGEPDADGYQVCSVCGATQQLDNSISDTFSIAGWHGGVTVGENNKYVTLDSRIGNVSAVVGRLDKGMSITLKGYVYTTQKNVNSYYYPVLAIANIEEKGSIYQRNDNWSIYDSASGALSAWSSKSNVDAQLVNFPGADEAEEKVVYVSGPITSSNDLDGIDANSELDGSFYYQTADGEFVAEAEGNTLRGVPVELTWAYSEDCVVTMTWYYPTMDNGGRIRTATVKMPERQFYNAILHGEDVVMYFNEYQVIQNLKLEDIGEITVNSGANFLENTYIDASVFNVPVSYAGGKSAVADAGLLEIYAHTEEGKVVAKDDADNIANGGRTYGNWINLEDNKLSTAYKSFKVRVQLGNQWFEQTISATEAAKINIIANATDHTGEKDVTYNNATFLSTGLDVISFAQTEDGKVGITIAGAAANFTAAQKTALGAGDEYVAYVNLSLFQTGGTSVQKFEGTPTFKSGTTTLPGGYVVTAERADFVLPLNASVIENGITISGVNGADIVVSFGNISGITVTSTISQQTLKLNETAEITITYNLNGLATAPADAKGLTDAFQVSVGAVTSFFNDEGTGLTTGFRGYNGLTLEKVTYANKILTLTYHVPALNAASPSNYKFGLIDVKSATGLVYDNVYYTPEFNGENALKGDFYVSVDGSKLYITKAYAGEEITNGMLTEANLTFSANKGSATGADYKNYTYLQAFDFGYAVNAAGVATLTAGASLPAGLATVKAYVFGTLNNNTDTDRGALVVITVDLTKLGIRLTNATKTEGFAFNLNTTAEDGDYWYATVSAENAISANNKITLTGNSTKLNEGVCISYTDYAELVGEGAFYANVTYKFEGQHTWVATKLSREVVTEEEDADGNKVSVTNIEEVDGFKCSVCGAVRNYNGDVQVAAEKLLTGALGELKGLSVSFETRGPSSDWGAQALVTTYGNMIVTLPNLDPWNNTVATDVLDAEGNVLFQATADEKGLASALAGGNCFPAGEDLFNGGAWNSFLTSGDSKGYSHAIISISENEGIQYYLNGVLVVSYAPTKAVGGGTVASFAKLFLSLAARVGVTLNVAGAPMDNVTVFKESINALQAEKIYNDYVAECGAPEAPKFVVVAPQAENTEEIKDTWTEELNIAKAGYSAGAEWYIKQGQKIVATGTLIEVDDANWNGGGMIFDRVLKVELGTLPPTNGRIDYWINGEVAGWNVALDVVATEANGDPAGDWVAKMKELRSEAGNVTVFTFDYSEEGKLVTSMSITGNGGSFTMTYTITALDNAQYEDGTPYTLDSWLLVGIVVDGNGFTGTAVCTKA